MRIRRLAGRVVGVGRRESSLLKAMDAGAVDITTTDLREGVRDADLVVLATPVDSFGALATRLAGCVRDGALVTEVGSTKEAVIEAVGGAMKARGDVVFIPTHPMAGSEKRGPENASPDLFEGAICIFTPLPGTPPDAVERLRRLWEALGADVRFMDPLAHDRLVARISHLPHLTAAALVNTVETGEADYAGGGLVDTTRVASGDPALWRAICESNARSIVEAIDAYAAVLAGARELITGGDFEALEQWLSEAKEKRDGFLAMRSREEN